MTPTVLTATPVEAEAELDPAPPKPKPDPCPCSKHLARMEDKINRMLDALGVDYKESEDVIK